MIGQHRLDSFYDAGLRVSRGFPAFVASMRVGEEPIGGLLEEVGRKKTGRAAIVFVHRLNVFNVKTAGAAKILCTSRSLWFRCC